MFQIRPYNPKQASDLESLYTICLATADNGGDASHLFRNPKFIGDFYAAPYAVLEPDFCFLLEDTQGICGYIVGALDTDNFNRKMNTAWLPKLRQQYPKVSSYLSDMEEHLTNHIHTDLTPDEELVGYPSHLHIDLLPRAQKQGQGKLLTLQLWKTLKEADSPGVHLGVSTKNTNAVAFYQAIGYQSTLKYETVIMMTKKF